MTDSSEPAVQPSRLHRWGVTALLALPAAWFVWDAIGSLVSLPQLYAQLGLSDDVPWVALWLGVVQPLVLYAAAVVLSRRQSLTRATLVLLAGLGAIAALRLSVIAIATGTLTVLG